MAQYTIRTIDPLTKTGTQLATDLNNWSSAAETMHSSTSRPPYAAQGMVWLDTTSDPVHKLKWYTGDADVTFVEFHDVNDTATFRGIAYNVQSATQNWVMDLDGSEHLRVQDVTGSRTPFVIEKVTPNNTVYLDSTGAVGINGAPPSVNAGLCVNGSTFACLSLAERASGPTADSTYGKLWVKNDDTVWFQDGAGNDLQIMVRNTAIQSFVIALSDETTPLTAGANAAKFRMPYAFTVTAVRAMLSTAGTGAALVTVDINENGSTILSTKLTIDASEKTSTTAATPAVISDTSLADDAEMTFDIDTIDTDNVAKGLKVAIIGYKTS